MKPELMELVADSPSEQVAGSVAREYLQARILEGLQDCGAMVPLAFHGGTALRFLYSMPRFSEDLDFALERAPDRYDLAAWLKRVQATLNAEGYDLDLKLNVGKTVQTGWIRFRGLLHELGLSPHKSQVVSIKLEVDTRPPAGAVLETTVVRRHRVMNLQHHDPASLLGGKLHAVLQRPYPKGRDLYDLLWYLSDRAWPAPNLELLRSALGQSDWSGPEITADNWRQVVSDRLRGIDWTTVAPDVARFLERPGEIALVTKENLLSLLA